MLHMMCTTPNAPRGGKPRRHLRPQSVSSGHGLHQPPNLTLHGLARRALCRCCACRCRIGVPRPATLAKRTPASAGQQGCVREHVVPRPRGQPGCHLRRDPIFYSTWHLQGGGAGGRGHTRWARGTRAQAAPPRTHSMSGPGVQGPASAGSGASQSVGNHSASVPTRNGCVYRSSPMAAHTRTLLGTVPVCLPAPSSAPAPRWLALRRRNRL